MPREFKFDIKQVNILKQLGLTAFIQYPAPDRVGWLTAERLKTLEVSPRQPLYRVHKAEVTFDSYWFVRENSHEPSNYRVSLYPWDFLMFTSYEIFFTEDIGTIERKFSEVTENSQNVLPIGSLGFNTNLPTEDSSFSARDLLRQRHFYDVLLEAQRKNIEVVWDSHYAGRTTGKLEALTPSICEIRKGPLVYQFPPQPIEGLRLYAAEQHFNRMIWPLDQQNPKPLAELPVWNYQRQHWYFLDTDGVNRLNA